MNPTTDQQEFKIWQTAKAQGKDDAFIKGAIMAYRANKATPAPTAPVTSMNNLADNENKPIQDRAMMGEGNQTSDNMFQSIIKGPIKSLLVKPVLRTMQAGVAGVGAMFGSERAMNNANVGQTFDIPLLGKYYIEPLSGGEGVKRIVGEGLETAANLIPAGRAGTAVGQVVKGAVVRGAVEGGVAGGIYGGLSGAGADLQDNSEATLGSVLESSLLGGAVGTLSGATLGVGGAVASKAIRGTTKLVSDLRTPEGIYNKLADTNASILNMTKRQITGETRYAKDTPAFIAREAPDARWNVTKEGKLDTAPVIDALEPKYHAEAQAFNMALKDSGEYGNIDDLQRAATEAAKKEFKGTAQDEAIKKIDNEILAYKKQYASSAINHNGETILPIHLVDDIKSDLWSKTKFYQTPEAAVQSQTSYLMGNAAKNMIENTVKDAPIKEWNKRLGDFASAIKILNQRNGTSVGAGAYSKTGARILGGIAGHTLGGIPGEIAGMVTADQLLKMASDPNVKSFVLKKLLQRMQKNGQAGIIDEVQQIMNNRATERMARKALPPPPVPQKVIDMNAPIKTKISGGPTIPLGPATPPESTVKAVPAKAISIKNPKTGRFEKAYTSETKNQDSFSQMTQPTKKATSATNISIDSKASKKAKGSQAQKGNIAGKTLAGGAAALGAGTAGAKAITTPKRIAYADNAQASQNAAPAAAKDDPLAKTLMHLESSGGTNKANADKGEMKWLTGLTDVAIKELKRTGVMDKVDVNNKADVLKASVEYFNLMHSRHPDLTPAEIYVNYYWTQGKTQAQKDKKIKEFNRLMSA